MKKILDFLIKVKDFFATLYHDHFALIVISIVSIAVLIITLIVLIRIGANKRKQKKFKDNKIKAVKNLTPEEIDNISKNVADKNDLFTYLSTPETEESAKPKKETTKAKKDKVSTTDKVAPAKTESTQTKPTSSDSKSSAKATKSTTTKPTTTKTETSKPNDVITQKPIKKQAYLGKWKIKELDGKFFAELVASNGSLLLRTEKYTSISGVKNGIETIKKNIDNGNVVISLDKHGHYHFKLYSNTNRLICVSEDYSSKAKCESGIESVKRFAQTPTIIREESDNTTK